jgi:hypothetical protein
VSDANPAPLCYRSTMDFAKTIGLWVLLIVTLILIAITPFAVFAAWVGEAFSGRDSDMHGHWLMAIPLALVALIWVPIAMNWAIKRRNVTPS